MSERLVLLVTLERPPFEGVWKIPDEGVYCVRVSEEEAETWIREHGGVILVRDVEGEE